MAALALGSNPQHLQRLQQQQQQEAQVEQAPPIWLEAHNGNEASSDQPEQAGRRVASRPGRNLALASAINRAEATLHGHRGGGGRDSSRAGAGSAQALESSSFMPSTGSRSHTTGS